jgi:hypothetical protein
MAQATGKPGMKKAVRQEVKATRQAAKAERKEAKGTRQAAKAERKEAKGTRQAAKAERKEAKSGSGTAAPKRSASKGKPLPKGMSIAPRGSGTKEPAVGTKKTPREKAAAAQERMKAREVRSSGKPAPKEGIRAARKEGMRAARKEAKAAPQNTTAQTNPRSNSMANRFVGFNPIANSMLSFGGLS